MPEPTTKSDFAEFYDSMNPQLAEFSAMDAESVELAQRQGAFPILAELREAKPRYTGFKLIGSGAIKDVYEVVDSASQQKLAMAKLKDRGDAEASEAFLREARLTASLQHPNIIPVHDLGIDEDGVPYFTMQLHRGRSLREVMVGDSVALEELLELFVKVCEAVSYAHSRGVVHLDLKPENIHIGTCGEVHVCDWGIARIMPEELDPAAEIDPNILNDTNCHRWIKGSLGFMAPEQFEADAAITMRSDGYALGAILFNMCTGVIPVTESMRVSGAGAVTPEFVSESLAGKEVARGLQAIIQKALSHEVNARYAAVEDMKQDVLKFLRGYATVAENASFWTQCALLVKRNAKVFTALTAMLFLVVLTTIASFRAVQDERELALVAKDEALRSLELLSREQEHSQSLQSELGSVLTDIQYGKKREDALEKQALLIEAIEREPKKKIKRKLERQLIVLSMAVQDFTRAAALINGGGKLLEFKEAAEWAATRNADGVGLTSHELAQLLQMIGRPDHLELIKSMYIYHRQKEVSGDDVGELFLANVMLDCLNNFWGLHVERERLVLNGSHLKVPPLPYQRFVVSKFNILAPIEFDSLDLSDTAFFEFVQLRHLVIERLDLSGCRVNEINAARVEMLQSYGVKEITCSRDFMSAEEMALLRGGFQTVVLK